MVLSELPFVLSIAGFAVVGVLTLFIVLLLLIAGLDGTGLVLLLGVVGVVGVLGLLEMSLPAVCVVLEIVELGFKAFSELALDILGLTAGRVGVLFDGLTSLAVLEFEFGRAAAIVSYLWLKLIGVKSLSPDELLRELLE